MREKNNKTVYFVAYGAVIAAIYTVLTLVFAPISFGPVQFRIAEALCILPFFTPAAVPGVFIGCLLSNLLCGAAPLDRVWQPGDVNRGSRFLWAAREQVACMPAADSGQHCHHSMGSPLCVWLAGFNSGCHGDSGNR